MSTTDGMKSAAQYSEQLFSQFDLAGEYVDHATGTNEDRPRWGQSGF